MRSYFSWSNSKVTQQYHPSISRLAQTKGVGRRHGKKNTVPKILSLQWIHSHVRQKNICNNNNNSLSYFVWFYFYFCYNSVFIMKWNKCLVIIFVTRASPTWVKWRTSALGTHPILQKVNNADSAIQAIYSCFFVLFCFVLHVPTRFSICAKQIYIKNESPTCLK